MQTKLVERGHDGLSLTSAGQDLFDTAARFEKEIGRSEARIAGQVTLTCPGIFLDMYLAPHLVAFCRRNPEIDLQILSAFEPVDVMRREADVAVRISNAPPEALVGRRVCRFGLAAYVSREFAAGPGAEDVAWIGWADGARERALITTRYPDAVISHRTDGMIAMRALVRAGLGASVLPCYWADHDPGLTRLFAAAKVPAENGLWVLAHPDVARAARVQMLTRFLSKRIRADAAWFEGRTRAPEGG